MAFRDRLALALIALALVLGVVSAVLQIWWTVAVMVVLAVLQAVALGASIKQRQAIMARRQAREQRPDGP